MAAAAAAAAAAAGFPNKPSDYELREVLGEGGSAVVWRAWCHPLRRDVAVKIFDLEALEEPNLDEIRREIQVLTGGRHPNIVQYFGSFVNGAALWVVMQLVSEGSVFDIVQAHYRAGLDETVIATILKEALKGLAYFHQNRQIHRDFKAGNILVNRDGSVLLGDFGVTALLNDGGGSRKNTRTFVGTPCWMAPEVMEQVKGYDTKADIWSFGITAIELARGQAPYAKYPPMKIMLLTLQNPPPSLDKDKDRFSKAFRDMIDQCLQKNPAKRPTAEQLLKHKFFKAAKKPDFLVGTLLKGLEPAGERWRRLQQGAKDAVKGVVPEGASRDVQPTDTDRTGTSRETRTQSSGWDFDEDGRGDDAAQDPEPAAEQHEVEVVRRGRFVVRG